MTDTFTEYRPEALPAPLVAYLDAHDEDRYDDAAAAFAPEAAVIDNDHTYDGIDAIRTWIEEASSEYTYASTRIGQRIVDENHPVVQVRLEGDFPGGTVTLRYQFEVQGGLIRRLVIEV